MFSWKKQLEVGQAGEHLLLEHYHTPIAISNDLRWDFIRLVDGGRIEVKTDTYSLSKTPNFFMERWGNEEERKPGGPWRARKHSVDDFVYFFVMDRTYFLFSDIKEVCARADRLIKRKSTREVRVKNKGYLTVGYPLERKEFQDLYTVYHIGEKP